MTRYVVERGAAVELAKTPYKATIHNGRTHVDRRIYHDSTGADVVILNGLAWELAGWARLPRHTVTTWRD